ncbi:facilitated trehalose transporter Tret1-like [Coccinella septempunctata]|uniref:facilitated trehalose transporter Tret1-like n=1 Tax=Coccinella septempunctata TaxID=41139 RepID=UPI001D0917A5|nr:facilitated trehalose transporter Tret1-like [Coccinella septempunctata]
MAIWEKFARSFGSYYSIFITCLVHQVYFNICLSAAWPSPVLTKLSGMEDNPLGRLITAEESDLIGSLFYIGASIGPLLIIVIVEKLGRKDVLIGLSLIIPLSYIILTFTENVHMYYFCRTLLGFYSGAALSIQPVYLTEILAPSEREFLMSLVTIFNFLGILYAYAIGPFIPIFWFNLSIVVLSILVFILQLVGCPESPYHIMKTKGLDSTRTVLKTLRNKTDVEIELQEIQTIVTTEVKKSYSEIFKSKDNWKALLIGTAPLVIQQCSGMPVLVTYSQLIFNKTNLSISSEICSIIVVILQLSTTFLTPTFMKCNTFTRKALLIMCLTFLALSNLVLALYFFYGMGTPWLNWVPLVGLIAYVVSYNCGIDPIPWMIIGEIYPMSISAAGSAISSSLFFGSIFPVLYSFKKVDIGYLFLISFTDCIIGILFFAFVYVKVKKSYRQSQNLLK